MFWVQSLGYKDRVIGNKKKHKHIEGAIVLVLRIKLHGKAGQINFHIIR